MESRLARYWSATRGVANNLEDFVGMMREFTRPRTDSGRPARPRRKAGAATVQTVSRRFLFRGVSDDTHDLLPSLPRLRLQYPYLTADDLDEIERQATGQFTEKAHLYLDQRFLPGGRAGFEATLHWWQLMQHHGARTRLLDWSASPFVAAYFAAVSEPEKDGAIWMIDEAAHRRRMMQMFPQQYENGSRRMPLIGAGQSAANGTTEADTLDAERSASAAAGIRASLFFCPCWLPSSRMSAQRGWFSCATVMDVDHGDAIARAFTTAPMDAKPTRRDRSPPEAFARKIVVSHRAKSAMLRDLWRMNITGETMYLGLDGLGKAMAELPALMRPQGGVRFVVEEGLLAERAAEPAPRRPRPRNA